MNNEELFKCYCHARREQAFYTKCLDQNNYTSREKELIYELVRDSMNMSNKIKQLCTKQ